MLFMLVLHGFLHILCTMPHCKECIPASVDFPTIKALKIHLQIVHKFTVNSIYSCGERGCCRKFSNVDTFMKHLKNAHQCSNVLNITDCMTNNTSNTLVQHCNSDESCMNDISNCNVTNSDNSHLYVGVDEFHGALQNQASAFVSKLYSKPSLPRNNVQSVIDDAQSFMSSGFVGLLKDRVLHTLNSSDVESSEVHNIKHMFESLESPFSHLQTEHMRLKYYSECGHYIPPKSYVLGKRLKRVNSEGGVKARWVDVTAEHIPLKPVLKNFLELPHALSSIKSYVECLNSDAHSDTISNFIQGSLWKAKLSRYEPGVFVLPLFVYFDDFEPNNPLGPHSSKLGGVYVLIPCLPPECVSRLENIFVTLLFNSADRAEFSNKTILEPLLKELEELESVGLSVTVNGVTQQIIFMLGLILGDNLGLHQLCNFVASFSKSNFPCRYCKARNEVVKTQIENDDSLLRNKHNYDADVALNNVTLTGIAAECEFNNLPSFHITENAVGDPLHDLDEGVSHYVMIFVINQLIQSGHFTLKVLNFRIQMFDFGMHSTNKPPCIQEDRLSSSKLKMTGSEMLCFVRHFGVLIGDLVPENDINWQLYLSLQHVLDVIMAKTLPKSRIQSFSTYVKEMAQLYLREGNHLTIKFHLLLWHYAELMKSSGPVSHLSCKRFESKHRQLKMSSNVNMSRVNLTKSVAIKHQLALCHRFVANTSILPELEMGPGHLVLVSELQNISLFENSLPAGITQNDLVSVANWVQYKGTCFKVKMVLLVGVDDNVGWPLFGAIQSIFVYNDKVFFICCKVENLGLHEHLHAYNVVKQNGNWFCVASDDLHDPLPLSLLMSATGEYYVVLRYLV